MASFCGTQLAIKGETHPHGGYALIWILDKNGHFVSAQIIDFYSKVPCKDFRYISPSFPKGMYYVEIEVLGTNGVWCDKKKNRFGSYDYYITIENILKLN